MNSKKKHLFFLYLIISSIAFSQNIENRKRYLIDSLKKEGVDTITVIRCAGYGWPGTCIRIKKRKNSKKGIYCSVRSAYIILWKAETKFYCRAFNDCMELPLNELNERNWWEYFKNNKETITSLKPTQNCIVLNGVKVMYSMNCDSAESPDSYRTIDHYGFYELEIYTGASQYQIGELNEFLFCNNKTKNLKEVRILGMFYSLVKEMADAVRADLDKNGKLILENFKQSD